MITVLTAAYGGDKLQEQPEQSVECRWLAVTDHDDHPTTHGQWEHLLEPRPHLSPRMAAKIPKYLPAMYVKEEGAVVLWLDCSVRLTSPHAVDRLTLMTTQFGGMSMLPHPDRRTVQDEWPEAAAQGRYEGQMVREQAEWYAANPMNWTDDRLWATTVISQVINAEHHVMGLKWMVQNCFWTAQDQISLPWIAANSYVHIWPIPLDLWHNDYFTLRQRERDA